MKRIFSKAELMQLKDCYSSSQMASIIGNSEFLAIVDLPYILAPLKDQFSFLIKHGQLTDMECQEIAIDLSEIVLPIYEQRNPGDKNIRTYIDQTRDYINGKLKKEQLLKNRHSVAAASANFALMAAVSNGKSMLDNADMAIAVACEISSNYPDKKYFNEIKQYLIDIVNASDDVS